MAKKKKSTAKYFDCNTCTERTLFGNTDVCSLRIKSIDDLQCPNTLSICEDIKFCEFYRKDK